MGMSSSQARLLSLTARMHDIEYKAQRLEAQKLQLANDSSKVYEEYLNALDARKIQYRTITNEGVCTYVDATYFDLCSGNTNPPFALMSTDGNKVILSPAYASVYNSSANAEEFATTLSGYTPPVLPTAPTPSPGSPIATAMPPSSTSVTPAAAVADLTQITASGSSIAAPTNTTPETPSETPDVTLSRGDAEVSRTINAGAQLNVRLLNPFNSNGAYNYTFKNETGSNENVKLKYLENGRLMITASNITIDAKNGQRDDLIIYGNGNKINTGNLEDTIRIGQVTDSMSTSASGYLPTSNYTGNTVNTGDGNDYVIARGNNTINMAGGSGDSIQSIGSNSVSNQEKTFTDLLGGVDTTLGWTEQHGYGDCKFLSFLNSLKAPLSSYLSIARNSADNGYEVKFKSLQSVPAGSIYEPYKTITVTDAELSSALSVRSQGDKTNVIVEAAFLKLISGIDHVNFDEGGSNTFGSSLNDYLLSKYFYGLDSAGEDKIDKADPSRFKNILQKYLSGQVTNLVVAVTTGNTLNASNGIMGGHAYAVKSATPDGAGGYSSIQVVNPHDGNDVINLDWNDFLNCFDAVVLYGDTYNMYVDTLGYNQISCPSSKAVTSVNVIDLADYVDYANSDTSTDSTPSTNISAPSSTYIGATIPPENAQFNALFYLWHQIRDFGYVTMDDDSLMNSTDYLTNVLQGGFAYLAMYDKNENKWVDTSVSITTSLQEVQNERELKKAEAKYEADMRKIDLKDRRYDSELAAVDTERNAIKQEMDTLKTVAKDNTERTFKLFS